MGCQADLAAAESVVEVNAAVDHTPDTESGEVMVQRYSAELQCSLCKGHYESAFHCADTELAQGGMPWRNLLLHLIGGQRELMLVCALVRIRVNMQPCV